VEMALHDFFRAMPGALTIWFSLVALVGIGCCFMAVPALYGRYHWAKARAEAGRLRQIQLGAQAGELRRYADEVAVAAARSTVTAQRREAQWEGARRAGEAAWRAFESADTAARRMGQAGAIRLPMRALTSEDLRDRERYLHRTATDAYRRGELSLTDLNDILAHRNGWGPQLHPADQEVALRRIARQRLWAAYQAVAAIERTARHHADVAVAAQRSLHDEAFAAMVRAQRAEDRRSATGARRGYPVPTGRRPLLVTT